MRLPSSPYNRLLREGVNFFSELKPGTLKKETAVATETLTTTDVNYTNGTSEQDLFNPTSSISEKKLDYTGPDETGSC